LKQPHQPLSVKKLVACGVLITPLMIFRQTFSMTKTTCTFDHTFNDLTEVINEPLMREATSLIDQVLAKKGTPNPDQVHIIFTDDEYYEDQSEVILDFVNHDGEASIYKDRISGQSVWLCPVLQRMDCFHGVKPSTMYVCIDALTE
jgi:hypothetical protein